MDDSIYRLRDRDLLALCVLALLAVGVVMVQSAAMNVGAGGMWHWSERGTRHLLFAILALLSFITLSRFDYRALAGGASPLRSPGVWALGVALVLCAAVLVPGLGTNVNGARRWLVLGPVRLQPSELAKWATVLFLAWRLSRPGAGTFWGGFLPSCAGVGLLCLLVVIEDFGTAALIGLAAFVMLLAGPTKWWHLALAVPPAILAAVAFIAVEPYRWRRMTAFLDPWAAPETDGYHMIQSLYSFAGGGLTGVGLGNGVQKLGYLPEDTTDFIFAVICEELGLFGAGLVAVLYLTILAVGFSAARKAPDGFGRLLCFGVAAMIGLQAVINIAVATASVPTKGMSLPLVSAGGSGLILTAVMLAMVYSVCRGEAAAVMDRASAGAAASDEEVEGELIDDGDDVEEAGGDMEDEDEEDDDAWVEDDDAFFAGDDEDDELEGEDGARGAARDAA